MDADQRIFSKITFFKWRQSTEKNELQLGFLLKLLELQIFNYFLVSSEDESRES